jgi:dTDP-4-dehydrorhamnose reductase
VRVLVTGSRGQLGTELARTAPVGVELVGLDLPELDISDAAAMRAAVQAHRPHAVVNAAAFTQVDKAETERERAFAVNAQGAENAARAALDVGARVVHVSTDYVFDGRSGLPYKPGDAPNPQTVYGASKLEGERRVLAATGGHAVIVRTAWVYASHGQNFARTMLRLMGERPEVRVVADQLGTPTWAKGLARALWTVLEKPEIEGILHWTAAGTASWYDFAMAIREEALALGLPLRATAVTPIRTDEYPAAAPRPPCAVLDKSETWRLLGRRAWHWREELREMLAEIKQSTQAT